MGYHCNCPGSGDGRSQSPAASVVSYAKWFFPKINIAFDTPIKAVNGDGWALDASFMSRAVIELSECNMHDVRCHFFFLVLGAFLLWKIWNYYRLNYPSQPTTNSPQVP